MKTKELIRQLMKADPTGEEECVVGGQDIYFVESLPGYYDGCYELLSRDSVGSVVGMKVTRAGTKIQIHVAEVDNFIADDNDFPIELDESLNAVQKESRGNYILRLREECK